MKLSNINKAQRLYVLNSNGGFTCYGFDVLNTMAANLLEWLKAQGRAAELLLGAKGIDVKALAIPSRVGTKKHFIACDRVIDSARRYAVMSNERCDAGLTQQLIGLEGKHVEVVDVYGEKRRFYVGRSSGWMPCHLEVKTRRSNGGESVTGAPFKSINVIN